MIQVDESRRAEGLARLEQVVGQPMPIGPEWRVLPVVDGDECLGAILVNGSEVHIGIARPLFLRGLIRTVLESIRAEHGVVTTKVRQQHAPGHRFVQRLGFKPVGEAGPLVLYEMKEARHA